MEIRYNVTGSERKRLVQTIAQTLEVKAKYLGMPSMAYEIDTYTVDRDGTLSFSDRNDTEEVERLIEAIAATGFECEPHEGFNDESTDAAEDGGTGLTVEIPFDKVNVGNLTRLLEAKGGLIRKALGVDDVRIEMKEDRVSFPWFTELPSPDEIKAYTHFIAALCEMSRNATRVTAKEKEVDNEKYAFRCFLLRLGFIGEEYKTERKILLKNLSGSSAFRNGAKKEYAPGLDPVPTPENTVPFDVEEAKRRLQDPAVQAEVRAIINGEGGDAE